MLLSDYNFYSSDKFLFIKNWIMTTIIQWWIKFTLILKLTYLPFSPGKFSGKPMISWISREISRENIRFSSFPRKFPGKSRKCVQRSHLIKSCSLQPSNHNSTHMFEFNVNIHLTGQEYAVNNNIYAQNATYMLVTYNIMLPYLEYCSTHIYYLWNIYVIVNHIYVCGWSYMLLLTNIYFV